MGFLRSDPKKMIWQSDAGYALEHGHEFFTINVAKEFYNPKAKLWLKYPDLVPIDINDLFLVAEITRNNFEREEKTLIHCIMGVHRSVTFALASIMYIYNVKIKDAMKMLCEPCIDFNIYVYEIPHHFNSLQDFYIEYVHH
ncbi:MAG TPA: dual specificity protein phosphatase [Aquella sp.]|nr:dual specificity protein phosphatase [Aquella sp.]